MIITTSSVPGAVVGTAYSQPVIAAGGTGSYTWTLSAGALPAGLALSNAGVISGTPTTVATGTFTVKVTSGTSSATQAMSIAVTASTSTSALPVFVQTVSLPNAIVGTAYAQALLATGGGGAITWSLLNGALPAGISLSSAGVLTGTPTVAALSSFTVLATSGLATAAQALTLSVLAVPTPPVVITSTTLPGGTANTFYTQTLAATGGTGSYTWAVSSGNLPNGLTLSSAGVLSGTPTSVATTNFTVQVTSGGATATQALSVTIASSVLTVTTNALTGAPVGANYSRTLTATGGTGGNVWVLLSGTLPAGVTLSAAGVLSGIPLVAGTYSFTVQVTSGVQVATQALSVVITVPGPVVISTLALPDAPLTVSYNATLAATGGTGSYGWSVVGGSLPTGITLSGLGTLSGTPTVAGTSSFTVQALSGAATATQALSILVDPLLAITTASLPSDSAGKPYNQTLISTGGTGVYAWTVSSGALPTGLALSGAGAITGTPTTAGTYNFDAKVTSGTQFATHAYSVTINPAAPIVITTTQLNGGVVSAAYSRSLAASGGTGVFTWSISGGALPLGLTLSSAGVISGTPTAVGTSNFTVQATSGGANSTIALSIVVTTSGVLVVTTPATLPDSKKNVAYSYPLLDIGGPGVSSWAVISGALPPGVVLLANGTVQGTPTFTGSFAFTVQSTNGALTAAKAFTLNVTP